MTLQRGQRTDRHAPFQFSAHTRVDFSDTDAQAIVYYGRYLPYFDMARVEYLRHLGLLDPTPGAEEFVMRALSVEYFAPARFDDAIEIFVRVARIGRSSVTWEFAAYHVEDDRLLVTSSQTAVFIDLEARRPVPVSPLYRTSVQALEGAGLELREPGVTAADALTEVERLAAAGGDADEVLRAVVAAVHDAGVPWFAVRFNEEGTLVDGPSAGTHPDATVTAPVSYNGERIGELEAAGVDEAFLERVASLLAEYVLLGWDTGGETWEP